MEVQKLVVIRKRTTEIAALSKLAVKRESWGGKHETPPD